MASGIYLAIAVAVAAFAARSVLATALVHVRQQRELARALDGPRDLHLVAPARAGDPSRADLALLGDELAQRGDVLVVDLVDLVAAVLAGLAPADRLAASARLCHQRTPRRRSRLSGVDRNECTKTSLLRLRMGCRRRRRRPVRSGSPLRRSARRLRWRRRRPDGPRSGRLRRRRLRASPGTAPNRQ